MRVQWVSDEGALANLREPWTRLLENEATPFCDHECFTCWWQAFGAGSSLSICAVWDDGELVGVAPLQR